MGIENTFSKKASVNVHFHFLIVDDTTPSERFSQ